jgi:hypothetical protein
MNILDIQTYGNAFVYFARNCVLGSSVERSHVRIIVQVLLYYCFSPATFKQKYIVLSALFCTN